MAWGLAGTLLSCGGAPKPNGDREVLARWLLCEECIDGELDSLRAPARRDRIVPLLAEALRGPPLRSSENVRRQLDETYQQLARRAVSRDKPMPLTRDAYVAHYLGNYEAGYQSRAITGLVAIGTPDARQALAEAHDRVRSGESLYRGDVVEELIRADFESWTSISAGTLRTCGIRRNGKSYCWGQNDLGQLGDSTTTGRPTPTLIAGNLDFTSIVTGAGFHTCGIAGSRLYCWGSNARGELGDGTTTNRSSPTAVAAADTLVGVTVGGNHTCAWTSSNRAYCWGGNNAGQLGNGNTEDKRQPVRLPDAFRFTSIRAGAMHTCGDSLGGPLYCWGSNSRGQLGNKSGTDSPTPVPTIGLLHFTALALGGFHGCALKEGPPVEGVAYCVGSNSDGRLGDSSMVSRDSLVKVSGGYSFLAISAGADHTCGITRGSQSLRCWGNNTSGQLGDGTTINQSVPILVLGSRSFTSVSAGSGHTCGITTDGVAYCWGRNNAGQLGDGTSTNRLAPTPVRMP